MLGIEYQLIDHSFTYLNSPVRFIITSLAGAGTTAESDLNDCGGPMTSVTVLSGSFGVSDHRLQYLPLIGSHLRHKELNKC